MTEGKLADRSWTTGALLEEGRRRLLASSTDALPREAALLLAHTTRCDEATLYAHPENPVPESEATRFLALLERRLKAEPVAYLLGEREFWGRPFSVDSRVLIPRPETEHLIETALRLEIPRAPRILDIGTGSGAIALTLALEIPEARVIATDLSLDALAVAAENRARHELTGRVALVQGDLTAPLRIEAFDLVVSNPPYVAASALSGLDSDVRDYEPRTALVADDEGIATIRQLSRQLIALLPGTPVLIEIGFDQEASVRSLFGEHFGPDARVSDTIIRDYAGHPRLLVTRRR